MSPGFEAQREVDFHEAPDGYNRNQAKLVKGPSGVHGYVRTLNFGFEILSWNRRRTIAVCRVKLIHKMILHGLIMLNISRTFLQGHLLHAHIAVKKLTTNFGSKHVSCIIIESLITTFRIAHTKNAE